MNTTWIDRLRRADQQRPSFPGEHWLVATAGMWLLRRRGGSLPVQLASKAAGAALLYRAASGRDGIRRLWSGGQGSQVRPQGRLAAGDRVRGERFANTPADGGARPFQPDGSGGFPERGAGSSYEPRGNPAVSGFPDFR
jgi:hypothetical protein